MEDEYITACNIKSRVNRHSVQSSLKSLIERIKTFKNIPDNGIAIFASQEPYV